MTTVPLDEWINAVQLSIQTPIAGVSWEDQDTLQIQFTNSPKKDSQLDDFTTLVSGQWSPNKHTLTIRQGRQLPFELLTNFFLLTRLQKPLMVKLAEQDPKYLPYLDKLNLVKPGTLSQRPIGTLSEAASYLFACVAQKKMTLRELSEATGLTQVSLSRFKGGQDVKLSNFLKIAHALALSLHVSSS